MANEPIALDLHGANAEQGINLDDLERFLAAFRSALRAFSRELDAGPVTRSGRPNSDDIAATAFRVTSLKPGSALLELSEPAGTDSPERLPVDVPTTATANLIALVSAIDRDAVSPDVGDALSKARKALGRDGRFGIGVEGRVARVQIDSERVARWQLGRKPGASVTVTAITGRLHAFETEQPPRFSVRDQAGHDWSCEYEPELEMDLLRAVRQLVTVDGAGEARGTERRFTIAGVTVVREPEQTELFTNERVPSATLLAVQSIHAPQTLEDLAIPDLDDEERDAFLAAIFEQ